MTDPAPPDPALARYVRQSLFTPLGVEGQRRLSTSRALIVGLGALGSVLANTLARAGVGFLRIVDRDFLELNNLQRQVLYDEDDLAAALPKAIAAQRKLARINSQIQVDAHVADVDHTNIDDLAGDVDLLLDGTDNFEIRFLINDYAVAHHKPWVYGGCIGAEGQTMTIIPDQTPCLTCLMPEAPPPGTMPTCDTAGILGPIVNVVASLQALEAIKILSGHPESISRQLTVLDLWDNQLRQVNIASLRDSGDCPTCAARQFPWLEGRRGSQTAILCGRNAVQLSAPGTGRISLEALATKLATVGRVTRNPFLLRLAIDDYQLTIFPDGRAIIAGTNDIPTARTLYAKYIGA